MGTSISMVQKIKKYILEHNLIQKGDRLVIGVSGGADSVALLMILCELQTEWDLQLFAVHINHGIRDEAHKDAEYVEILCRKLGIPFYLFCENIPRRAIEKGMSEEEMGRHYRYECFAEIAEKTGAKKIVVAHHENDQAETILFHMLRGTDLKGLKGMQPQVTKQDGTIVIRPFLCVNREEIEMYLKERQILWCEDRTNQDNHYSRNALRNLVIPAMEQINSQTVPHIVRLAQRMSEYEQFFQEQVESYIRQQVKENSKTEYYIKRESLGKLPPVLARGVLYEVLCRLGDGQRDIEECHVEAIYGLLTKQSGKELHLPYGIKVNLLYENLVLRKSLEEEKDEEKNVIYQEGIIWQEGKIYDINIEGYGLLRIRCTTYSDLTQNEKENLLGNIYTKYFDCDTIKGMLCVRTPVEKDVLCIHESGKSKKLSRYLKDVKINRNRRRSIPVLAWEHRILYIAGYRRCEEYKITEHTKKVLVVTYEGEHYGSY